GCEDYYNLEEVNPNDSIDPAIAITNLRSAQGARAGIYSGLQASNFDRYLAGSQYYSDEADWTGTFPTRAEFDIYNVITSNTTLATMFTSHYATINDANAFLDVVPSVDDPSLNEAENIRSSLLAEARFARGIAFFELTQGWRDVPIVLTPTRSDAVGDALNVTRSPQSEVYAQAISDFTFARDNLIDGASLGATVAAANGYLARIALYQGRWQDAISFATAAVGADYDLTGIEYLDDELFYIKFSKADGNSLAFFYAPSALGGRRSIAPSAKLVGSFEDGDLRAAATFASLSNGQLYGVKYDDFSSASGNQDDPLLLMRGAEMVLILAEANARLGNFDEANAWFNQVRQRAGLADLTLDADNFEDLILQERFVELSLESGHRLWDLRRTDRAEEVLGPDGYEACDAVWPLPQRDIDRNPNLEQNNCCNC
ncbi:MAG: RagB/SusD family nutrient uptake outer membrane protein, partial [Bacteroidota bacterium]